MLRTLFAAPILWGALLATPVSASADPFYDAALCKPPYTTDTATALYEAAEKLAKPDGSMLGAYVYKLPRALGQDGFRSSEVIFAGTAVGVLIEGLQADALAERYRLTKERSTLLGTATKGYSRALPQDQQPQPDLGIVSIVARESPSLPGKTLLMCEFVLKADQEALDRYEKSRTPQCCRTTYGTGSLPPTRSAMVILSAISYFLTHHPFWSWLVLVLIGVLLAHLLAKWRGSGGWYGLILVFFIYGPINLFTAHIFNALLLEAFGVDGTAVITQSEETSSTLNDQSIWAYDAVVKTAEGNDVVTRFDTMSASIYPITNAIMIPPKGERFAIRYIPGLPRNFVIMRDLSPYGKEYLLEEDRRPVEKAAAQFAASPNNKAFIAEYRRALAAFIAKRRNDADPALIANYQAQLDALPQAD